MKKFITHLYDSKNEILKWEATDYNLPSLILRIAQNVYDEYGIRLSSDDYKSIKNFIEENLDSNNIQLNLPMFFKSIERNDYIQCEIVEINDSVCYYLPHGKTHIKMKTYNSIEANAIIRDLIDIYLCFYVDTYDVFDYEGDKAHISFCLKNAIDKRQKFALFHIDGFAICCEFNYYRDEPITAYTITVYSDGASLEKEPNENTLIIGEQNGEYYHIIKRYT